MTTLGVLKKSTNQVHPGLKLHFDYWLLLAAAGLVVVGMLVVYSSTFDLGLLAKESSSYYIRRQFIALLLGIGATLVIMQFDYHLLRRFSVPLMVFTLLLLGSLLLIGEAFLGAQRGLLEGSFQPSELAKLAMILYIAHWLSSKGERIKLISYGLIPFSVIVGIVCALIVRQPDLSTSMLIAIVSFTLFFVAGADWRQFAAVGALGGVVFMVLINALPHAAARVEAYRVGWGNPELAGYHVQRALAALANGGWFGVGLGESTQKFGPLPAAHTDGAFAVLGEELGLFGALLVIGLFLMLAWRGVRTAMRARDSYGFLLAIGITCWLSYQALINVAVITAIIPFTGIPLPFLSYGGSSLLMSLIGVGILLNISRDAALTKRPQKRTQASNRLANQPKIT